MAALIATLPAEFASTLPSGGKLAGLDIGTKTIGLAICDAGWHFAGPCETLRRVNRVTKPFIHRYLWITLLIVWNT